MKKLVLPAYDFVGQGSPRFQRARRARRHRGDGAGALHRAGPRDGQGGGRVVAGAAEAMGFPLLATQASRRVAA